MSKKMRDATQHKLLQLLGIIILLHGQKIPAMHVHRPIHTCTDIHTRMDNPKNADSNCSLCAFSVERESKEWDREEFQISKAIFHFPPSEGI